ncbi:hypothetical protein [Actinomyces bowdenii]|uniref:hypothetical protein n=1 Tax=Actinomyces bowdenii TaxID=131109 RepID=UPI001639B7C1|nr:hypothetical protein [Actinomyces bowdenii]
MTQGHERQGAMARPMGRAAQPPLPRSSPPPAVRLRGLPRRLIGCWIHGWGGGRG